MLFASVINHIVPFILEKERARIKKDIGGKFVSVVRILWDKSAGRGSGSCVVLCFQVDNQQRLVRLEFLTNSINGEEVARELIHVLSTILGIQSHL